MPNISWLELALNAYFTKVLLQFLDFKGAKDTPVFPKIDGLTPEDDEWPWPDNDEDAEAKYLSLTRTGKGCPFRFLFY